MWLFSFFRYLRLKVHVSFIRLLVRWTRGKPTKAFPDSVLQIPSRDTRRTIKAHLYNSSQLTPNTPTPVLVNFHGSGFILPRHGGDDFFCRKITTSTPYSVLDIQYRLAPENPWPACHNDAEDVVNYVLANPTLYSKSQIAISGFSAGGNIACVAASTTFPKDTFSALMAFYPPTNLSVVGDSKFPPDTDGNLMPAKMERLFDASFLRTDPDTRDPRVSPSFGPVEGYPTNTLFVTCARDRLCLEAEALAKRVEDESTDGKNVVLRRMDRCEHGWDKRSKPGSYGEEKRDEAYGLAIDILNASRR